MNNYRIPILVGATLSATLWTYACGDGATAPPPPAPDPPRPATVAVAPATVQLTAVGATEQLTAEVRDQNGNAMAGVAVSWASSAATVATVSASGLVTAAANGTATITATAGSASGGAAVAVAQEVGAVAVTPAADTVVVGDTLRLAAEAADANGHPVAEAELDWASSDTLVAVVDDAGLVTGLGAGQAEVTASAAGITGRASLTIVAPIPTTVAVTPDAVALTALGQTGQLTAEVRDQAGRTMEGVPVAWSSGDTTVAAVDSAGLVTAAGAGETTITATSGEASGEAVVTVMQSAGSVIVSPPADTIAPDDTLRLVAEAIDKNGYRVQGADFTWSSSEGSVATVDAMGLVTGIAEGTATITAAAGDASGTSEITVENPDRAALVAFYEATNGPNWVNNDNWLTDAPLSEWHGVGTDGSSGRVVSLDLSGRWDNEAQQVILHGLKGTIPAELGALSELRMLHLSRNELSGPILPELGGLASLRSLDLFGNDLTGAIPPELGGLDNLEYLHLGNNELSGPIPPELGNLASLRVLWLASNDLSGAIPPELGNLSNLEILTIDSAALTGPIPESLLGLDGMRRFRFGDNAGLCAPGTADFVAWLSGIEHRDDGPYCNASDVEVLEALYDASGGPDWANSDGWLETPALAQWHGVTTDSLGRVTALDLTRNGLTGKLPTSMGGLTEMTILRIGHNALSGRLPLTLAGLTLVEFQYAETELCAPAEERFQTWLNGIGSLEGTGLECAALSDQEILEILYEATGGPDWTNNDNWLTDAPLRDWYGVRVDGQGRVRGLSLSSNNLTGSIPPELHTVL